MTFSGHSFHPYMQFGRWPIAGIEKFRPKWKREQSKRRRRATVNDMRMHLRMNDTERALVCQRYDGIYDEWHIS